jgi:folylpolyglutamate synthase
MAAKGGRNPRYFTFLTLLLFHAFLEQGVAATVVETGVRGEYDSTNVVEQPVATAITKIGINHVRALRRDGQEDAKIEDIAWHKAGIFKSGCPAFSVPQQSEVLEVLQQRAAEKGVPLRIVDIDGRIWELALQPDAQQENACLAVALTNIFISARALTEQARRGIERTCLPGRRR